MSNDVKNQIDIQPMIGTYRNNLSVENIIKLIRNYTSSKLIIVSWSINSSMWYISGIFDELISENIILTGWYSTVEPSIENLPFKHTDVIKHNIISTNVSKIIFDSSQLLNDIQQILIETMTDKLALLDNLNRQKNEQKILLNMISSTVRSPLSNILHLTNDILSTEELHSDKSAHSDKLHSDKSAHSDKLHSDKMTKYINNIHNSLSYLKQSSVSLANNIFDIVDLVKLETNRLLLDKEIFNVNELIETTIKIIKSLNTNPSIEINYYIDSMVPETIFSDPKRIKQILINMLENALHHTTKGSVLLYVTSIEIDLNMEDLHEMDTLKDPQIHYCLTFSIADTGSGIDEETKKILFAPLELTTLDKQYGVSLRVSYLLSHLLNGNIRLTNSELGKGSCFEFTMITGLEEEDIKVPSTLKQLKEKRILILDEFINNKNITDVLNLYQLKYITVGTIGEIEILHLDKQFDLIIIRSIKQSDLLIKILRSYFNSMYLSIGFATKDVDYTLDMEFNTNELKQKLLEIFQITRKKCNDITSKILFIEPEFFSKTIIEKQLKQLGYNVDSVSNCNIGLQQYNNVTYDLIITPIRMSGLSGIELATKIRNLNPNVKIIGITPQSISLQEVKPWIDVIVNKPIDFTELDRQIKTLLSVKK